LKLNGTLEQTIFDGLAIKETDGVTEVLTVIVTGLEVMAAGTVQAADELTVT
jgi:hypothetical protein